MAFAIDQDLEVLAQKSVDSLALGVFDHRFEVDHPDIDRFGIRLFLGKALRG